jgi:hypothetical protein
MEILREIEDNMDITRILMVDNDSAAHWQRCVDNNEPLTKPQFVKARALFSTMADKHGFERKQLKDFPNAVQALPKENSSPAVPANSESDTKSVPSSDKTKGNSSSKSNEQLKLERANIINDVLSKRIIRNKGGSYDEVERSIRHFLNQELGKILGTTTNTPGLTNEEVELLKFFCQRLKEKEQ